MDFKVQRDNTGDVDSNGGDATYSRDGCVLIVEDGRRQILYGPNGWICVEPDEEIACMPIVVEGPDDPFGTYSRCIYVIVENPNC